MKRLICLLIALAWTAQAHAAGLLAPTDQTVPPLRVTDHVVDVQIRDGVAITKLTQTFRNETQRRLEAEYIFPLPENADLTDFQMTFNGKMVQGEVLPAEEARRVYESIVRRMRDPGLIEFIGRRLLKMRVFPIEPGSDTTIKVRYQQICRPISGMTGYHYPLRTRKTAGQAYGSVRFNVQLHTSAALKNIWSPTHAVEIVRGDDEHSAKIAYEASGGSLNDDFILLYKTDESDLGLSVVAYKPSEDEDGRFVLMLTPKQLWPEQEYQPQDVVFVMDTSGSMAGDKIDQARNALKYCIEQLDERDRFSVVRFSTGFDVLFDEVKAATKERRAKAREWIAEFDARGGTNIADTLQHVLAMRAAAVEDDDASRPFVVVFLTDGRGNREANEIINTLADAGGGKSGLRIFPFGVGHDVNTLLLDRLADEYTGRTTYVQPGENLELVLGDFFSVISRPVLTNLQLSLPEIGASQRFPATLGDLYHGQQLILAGRFSEPATGTVQLIANRGDERVEFSWPGVAFRHTDEADYVPSVWAGRKIAFLIDQIRKSGESTEMVEEILALSQEYGIQTPYTAWLVAPEKVRDPNLGWRRGSAGAASGGRRARRSSTGPGMPPPPSRAEQERALRGAGGGGIGGGGSGGTGGGSIFDEPETDPARLAGDYEDEHGGIDLLLAGEAVTEESGKAANLIARRNAEMREARSKDESRLDPDLLPSRKIKGLWYNRIGRFLVDERIDAETEILVVRFASEAYFELARERPDLREILAARTTVGVIVADDHAILISDRVGAEEFSDEQRKQFGLSAG
jgi:Ca-activated chloride channel family protein